MMLSLILGKPIRIIKPAYRSRKMIYRPVFFAILFTIINRMIFTTVLNKPTAVEKLYIDFNIPQTIIMDTKCGAYNIV